MPTVFLKVLIGARPSAFFKRILAPALTKGGL